MDFVNESYFSSFVHQGARLCTKDYIDLSAQENGVFPAYNWSMPVWNRNNF